jgi:hypothetical protein
MVASFARVVPCRVLMYLPGIENIVCWWCGGFAPLTRVDAWLVAELAGSGPGMGTKVMLRSAQTVPLD